MPKKGALQAVQSTIGFFRVLDLDPKALPRTRPLYRRLGELVEGGIARGDVPAGYRLPPERDLAKAPRVSRATVVRAYRELQTRGLVRGYVGPGNIASAKPGGRHPPCARPWP